MLKKVESLIVTSETYEEVVDFFREALGLEMPASSDNMSQFGIKGFPIFVARCNIGSGYFISIESDDIRADYQEMLKKGVKFLDPIMALKNGDLATFFKGPANMDFMLYQPAADGGTAGPENLT